MWLDTPPKNTGHVATCQGYNRAKVEKHRIDAIHSVWSIFTKGNYLLFYPPGTNPHDHDRNSKRLRELVDAQRKVLRHEDTSATNYHGLEFINLVEKNEKTTTKTHFLSLLAKNKTQAEIVKSRIPARVYTCYLLPITREGVYNFPHPRDQNS